MGGWAPFKGRLSRGALRGPPACGRSYTEPKHKERGRDSHVYTWLGASLAWLLGTALQLTMDPPSRGACGAALIVGALGVLSGWALRAARGRLVWSSGGPRWWAPGLAAAGLVCLAWGLTGWRALDRLEQGWPEALSDQAVQVDLCWRGLPQRVLPASGDVTRWRVEARILRWHERRADSAEAHLPDLVQLIWDRSATDSPPRPGDCWTASVRLRSPDERVNPGVGDGALGRFGRGVRAWGRVVSAEPWGEAAEASAQGWWQGRLDGVDAWRQRVRDRIFERVADARAAGVMAGLTVGDQAAISRADWVVLQRTGTAHLVSISGTHVALLGVLAAWLVRAVWSRAPVLTRCVPAHGVAAWVALLASALYALAAGWGVPAQRTVWMMAFVTVLASVGRRWPWPLVWLPGAALVALCDPWAMAQPGFWLSFVAVGVLLAAGVHLPEAAPGEWAERGWWSRWRDAGSELLQTQRLVAVALAPLALVCFQQVSIVGVGVNVWAVPLFTLVFTPLSLLGVVWPTAWDGVAWGLNACWWALDRSAEVPGAVWAVPALPGWVAVGGIASAFVLALPVPWRWRVLALPFLLPFVRLPDGWHLLPRPDPGQFSVVVLDVGQGGATLVRTAKHDLMFDAGPLRPDGSDVVERLIAPLLQSLGVTRLDALVVSHDDADHSGGAASLLDTVAVRQLMTPFDADHALRQRGVAHRLCEPGASWGWDGVRFRWLHPGAPASASDNARSCVLQVEAAAHVATGDAARSLGTEPVRLLLTADIEADQERAMLQRWQAADLRSTVLLVPHHGSRTSSTLAWLRAVAPTQAVVQVGARNAYGHPSPVVMRRLRQVGIPVVTTPACGAYIWSSADTAQDGVDPSPPKESDGLARPVLGRCWRATRTHHWQR